MLFTLFVLCCLQRIYRSRIYRRQALSVWLITSSLVVAADVNLPAFGQGRFDDRQQDRAAARSTATNPETDSSTPTTLFGNQYKLREGTVVPPTVGRVVNLGRRWAFIPIQAGSVVARDVYGEIAGTDATQRRLWSQVGLEKDRITQNRGVQLGWESDSMVRPNLNAVNLSAQADDEPPTSDNRPNHIILCENHMLQRIVEATRSDANDDRWEISGEVLEFFDENRLLIRTIQRANSK